MDLSSLVGTVNVVTDLKRMGKGSDGSSCAGIGGDILYCNAKAAMPEMSSLLSFYNPGSDATTSSIRFGVVPGCSYHTECDRQAGHNPPSEGYFKGYWTHPDNDKP
jgi:hypothetical protein